MASMENFEDDNINTYRHTHESATEWNLRKAFLLAHHKTLAPDRLFCLASCFINVECYGCRYPAGVMSQLRELAGDIRGHIDEHRKRIQDQRDIKFVKAGGGEETKGKEAMPTYSDTDETKAKSKQITKSADINRAKPSSNLRFVKSGSDYASTDLTTKVSKSDSDEDKVKAESSKKIWSTPREEGSLKSALANFASAMHKQELSQMDQDFYALAAQVREFSEHMHSKKKSAIEKIHLALDRVKMVATTKFDDANNGDFCCGLYINCVFVSKGEGSNKKAAKHAAYESALTNLLMHPYLHVVESGDNECRLESSTAPFEGVPTSPPVVQSSSSLRSKLLSQTEITQLGAATKQNIHTLAKSNVQCASKDHLHALHAQLQKKSEQMHSPQSSNVHSRLGKRLASQPLHNDQSYFLIVEPQVKSESHSAVSILNQSAAFNKVVLDYDFREEPLNLFAAGSGFQVRCRLQLGHKLMADVASTSRAEAKSLAANMALAKLRQNCWTIQTKKYEDTDELGFSREEVLGSLEKTAGDSGAHIPDTNIGSKLLQKMGWSGGGVGKEGNKGIAEPVAVTSVINREGLGLSAEQGITTNFIGQVKEIVENYAKSDREEDISFSPDFTKEERAIIHKEAQKLGLKTHSHGKGDSRYLVVSRKRTANQLFSHILSQGGETSKYTLLRPGSVTE